MNNELYKQIIENTSDAVVVTKPQNGSDNGPVIIYVNKAYEEMTGYLSQEVIGKSPRILQGSDTQNKELDKLRHALKYKTSGKAELINYKKNGEPFWTSISISPIFDDCGNVRNWIGIKKDITHQKETAAYLENLHWATAHIVRELDLETDTVKHHQHLQQFLGYSEDEISSSGKWWREKIHPDDYQKIVSKVQEAFKSNKNHIEENYRYRAADGSYKFLKDKAFIQRNREGKPVKVIAAWTDISQEYYYQQINNLQKTAYKDYTKGKPFEEVLQEIIYELTDLHTDMHCAILEVHEGKLHALASPDISKKLITEIESQKIEDKNCVCTAAAYHKKSINVKNLLDSEEWKSYGELNREYKVESCWSLPILNNNDQAIAVLSVFYKKPKVPTKAERESVEQVVELLKILFTNREHTQQIIKANKRFETILNAIDEAVWEYDLNTNTVAYSPKYEELFGYSLTEVDHAISSWRNKLHDDDIDRIKRLLEQAVEQKNNRIIMEYRYKCAEGNYKYIYDRAQIIYDKNDKPAQILGIMQDVSHFKEREQKSKLYQDTIFSLATHDSINKTDSFTDVFENILKSAASALNVSRVNYWEYEEEQLTCTYAFKEGRNQENMIGTIVKEEEHKKYYNLLKNKKVLNIDKAQTDSRTKSLTRDYLKPANIQSLLDVSVWSSGKLMGVLCFEHLGQPRKWEASDINFAGSIGELISNAYLDHERAQKELQLKDSLKDKNVLLQEIHHRVKNNLAVLSGMMELQIIDSENKELQNKLRNTIDRVQTIAYIHELLYNTDNFSYLDVSDLVKQITRSVMSLSGGKENFSTTFNLDNVSLNINEAIPFSLILNEVITNVFKHAFKGISNPSLVINLKNINQHVYLSIQDNGTGMPENFNQFQKESLGMKLIQVLGEQLSARHSFENKKPGTEFKLNFKITNGSGSHADLVM